MSLNSTRARQSSDLLIGGLAMGIAGGLAEIVVVSLYGAGAGVSVADVARHIASAVRLDGASAWTGLMVHMALAAVLGVAIMFVWNRLAENSVRALPLYPCMLLALAAVWMINFFVVLPVLSPGFLTLLPLSVTLVSKLVFGCAVATTLRALSRPHMPAQGTTRSVGAETLPQPSLRGVRM
jgi:hypothetical protein